MAVCEQKNVSSNSTGLNYAIEECLGVLAEKSEVVWKATEPNSYNDFGAELSTVARSPISLARQDKKGTVTDLTASGGFNIDFTQNNCDDFLEAAFFAEFRRKANLKPTAVTATGYTVVGGTVIKENDLILASGFDVSVNNGFKVVGAGGTVTEVKVAGLQAETKAGKIQVVGHRFSAGDIKVALEGNIMVLTSTTADFTELNLNAGEWIFVGGDAEANRFENAGVGYARVNKVTSNKITFDTSMLKHVADTGAGKQIELYFGDVLYNEATADKIVRKTFTFERTLGKNLEHNDTQAEYLQGAVINTFKLNVPQGDKLNADLDFMATEHNTRSGKVGDKIRSSEGVGGKPVPALGETAYNTTQNVRAISLNVVDTTKSSSKPLFAYLTEADLTISNNLSENKAIGVMGAVDISAGNFQTSTSATAYFQDTRTIEAVRNNADVGLFMIYAQHNVGFVFDVPLITLGGGKLQVEKDNPITVNIDAKGAENKHGYTCMYVKFNYLPTLAM